MLAALAALSLALAVGGEIPLLRSLPAGPADGRCPVSVGVPFPPDALPDERLLSLVDLGGRPVPFQSHVTSRWWRRGGGVQTVLVTFVADRAQPVYTLRYGVPAEPVRPAHPVRVTRNGGRILVDNGALLAAFRSDRPGLFDELRYDADGDGVYGPDETVIDPAAPAELRMGLHSSLWAPATIDVEESGPVRAVVRLRGHHATPAGEQAIAYDVRLFLYSDLPYVRVEHRFVQDTPSIFLDVPSICLRLPLSPAGATVRFGLPDGDRAVAVKADGSARLVQTGPGVWEYVETLGPAYAATRVPLRRGEDGTWSYETGLGVPEFDTILAERLPYANDEEKRMWSQGPRHNAFAAELSVNGQVVAAAERAPGWLDVEPTDRPWGLAAGVRWFWQQHPKALGWSDGAAVIELYPELPDEPLHLHTGTAKTHTIDLWLHPAGDARAGVEAAAASSPPAYFCPPEWYCGSKVWGDIIERREGRFALYESEMDRQLEPYIARLEHPRVQPGFGGEFGILWFGDYGGGKLSNNLETAVDHGLAVHFLRTADRRVYDRFEQAVRHFRDNDVRNAVPAGQAFDWGLWLVPGYMPEAFAQRCAEDEALRRRVFFYQGEHPPGLGGVYRHGFRHYGNAQLTPYPPYSSRKEALLQMYSGTCAVGGHGWIEGLVDHYLLTGDRWSLEVAELTGQWVLDREGTSWGRDNWKYRDLARLYRATGRDEYLNRLYQAIDVIYGERGSIVDRMKGQAEALMSPYYTILQFIAEVHRVTDDPEVRRKYLELLDPWLAHMTDADSGVGPVFWYLRDYKDSRCHTDFADLAYAWVLTGDPRYIERSLNSADFYLHFAYHSTAWFSIPEYLYALTSVRPDALSDPPRTISGPSAWLREDTDGPFDVVVTQEEGYRVAAQPTTGAIRISAPSGKVIERPITMGGTDVHRLTVPADGETGLYRVEAAAARCRFAYGSRLPLTAWPPPRQTAGRFGGAVELIDRAHLVVPTDGHLSLSEGTIEFWLRPNWSSPATRAEAVPYHYNHIFDSRDVDYDHGIAIFTYDSGEPGAGKTLIGATAGYNQSDNVSGPLRWNSGEWHHVAFAWRAGAGDGVLRLYVDGLLVAEKTDARIFPALVNPRFTIGTNTPATANSAVDAAIDELRISSVMREPDPSGPPAFDEQTLLMLRFDDPAETASFVP